MDVELSQDGSSSLSDNQNLETTQNTNPATQNTGNGQAINSVTELDKLEKFRFEGQEYTPKALKEAILRMKDYTQKTQEHSKSVESFNQERKFYDNLWADLEKVRSGAADPAEFVRVYPEKFHGALKQVLEQINGGSASQQNAQRSQFDIASESRLQKLEKHFQEQEVAKNQAEINSLIDKYSKQFPKAIPRLAIADVFEAYNSGVKPTAETWEQAFKASEEYRKQLTREDYGELQKKQTVANEKGRDVAAGGGTPGRAPKKFGSLREVTEHAADSLSNR